MKRIVLTGGPCSGKSTVQKALRQEFLEQIVLVPEAATLLRRLGHAIVGHHVDDDQLVALTAAITPFVELMEADPPRFRSQSGRDGASHFAAPPEDGAVLEHFPDCIVSGRANPMGVAIEVHREGEQAVATVTLGPAFEGAPERSHGGIVAAVSTSPEFIWCSA